jgi:hypothetical protein
MSLDMFMFIFDLPVHSMFKTFSGIMIVLCLTDTGILSIAIMHVTQQRAAFV